MQFHNQHKTALALLVAILVPLCLLPALAGAQTPTDNPLAPQPTAVPVAPTGTLVNGREEATPGSYAASAFSGGVPTATVGPTLDPMLGTLTVLALTPTATLPAPVATATPEATAPPPPDVPTPTATAAPSPEVSTDGGTVQTQRVTAVAHSMIDLDQPATGQAIPDGQPLVVSGWAAAADDSQDPIQQVTIYLDDMSDGGRLGDASYGIPRPDVSSAVGRPDWGNSGFSLALPPFAIPAGRHTLYAAAYPSNGDPLVSSVDIEVSPSQ